MEVLSTIAEVRERVKTARHSGLQIGFVPTMGYLHKGHAALIRAARHDCGYVVVSIFVNPLQFGPDEDLERYPRDRDRDERVCQSEGTDLVFLPEVDELYSEEQLTRVRVEGLTSVLCGRSRPTHFEGVTTVVTKLFHIVAPDRAYFGQKDAQQATVIEKMVKDLNFDLEVVRVPTVREEDGLAVSSRNVYLDPAQRRAAPVLYRALQEVRQKVEEGQRDAGVLSQQLREAIEAEPLAQVEYARIVDAKTLQDIDWIDCEALAAVAVTFGRTRLIDNFILRPPVS